MDSNHVHTSVWRSRTPCWAAGTDTLCTSSMSLDRPVSFDLKARRTGVGDCTQDVFSRVRPRMITDHFLYLHLAMFGGSRYVLRLVSLGHVGPGGAEATWRSGCSGRFTLSGFCEESIDVFVREEWPCSYTVIVKEEASGMMSTSGVCTRPSPSQGAVGQKL